MTDWQKVTTGLELGGYVAWEAAVAEVEEVKGSRRRDHVPVFLELKPGGTAMTKEDAIDATLELPGVLFSRHERDLLATAKADAKTEAGGWDITIRVRAVVFCPLTMLSALPPFWDVLHVGPALAIPEMPDKEVGRDLVTTVGPLDPNVPLVAVIDDGIGFLNTRFRKSRNETRFKAVWLQAAEHVQDRNGSTERDVVAGRVLTSVDINKHLKDGLEEADVYRQVNSELHRLMDGVLTNQRTAHGTHVLDLAAGAAPWAAKDKVPDPMLAVPLLAVQLPPASIRETAGRRMEAYLVQGLRWILAEALRLSNKTDVPPLVINISLGSLAGPGDKTAFLADWFEYELDRHTRMTKGEELRLVIAYGNARQSRLAARDELRISHPITLQWRVLPDDHTSSLLELRVDDTRDVDTPVADGIKLVLTPPVGSGLPKLSVDWPQPGEGWQLAGPLAAVTSVKERGGQALLHLALGPTVTEGRLPSCPAGAWQVEVHTTKNEPVRLTARLQRDDTPPGYKTLGRQSWLDHPQGWEWDAATRSDTAPRPVADAPGCPVTREGSYVAYAGATDPRILFVGAARPDTTAEGKVRPMPYSSEGVRHLARPGESAGPTLVALGDDGTALPGRLGAGVLSGSVVRMSGTSMAAPAVARALVAYFLTVPEAERREKPEGQAERLFLTGRKVWEDVPHPRLGHGGLIARDDCGVPEAQPDLGALIA
ncbi:S8 family serine peptidase [Tabrizicola sp.]|uniref:S8 family serine peptidase n=1 Tax=Tabrizicola sp. TaxID=2005166 RepID=UPI003F3C7631